MKNTNSNLVSYVVKDIDKDVWKKFRGTSLLNGYATAGECLVRLIDMYANGDIYDENR